MKLIFLDIDGVLNNAEFIQDLVRRGAYVSMFEKHEQEFDPDKVKLLSDFALEVDASIVISSSWRKLHTLEELTEMLQQRGLDVKIHVIGVTPCSSTGYRGNEVNEWLKNTHHVIETHVIFDDDGDFYPHQPLVKTSWDDGLLPFHIERARELLNKDIGGLV